MPPLHKISIANDFSKVPAGRYLSDGLDSGQNFREKLVEPILQQGSKIEINLDGTEGFGSSFLEEAFGGLVRKGWTSAQIEEKISFFSEEDPTLIAEILGYIRDAGQR
jgi:hypothetical protein